MPEQIVDATWGDLGIGSVMITGDRPQADHWTVIDSALPDQFRYGRSVWFKFRNGTGREYTAPPRLMRSQIKLLVDADAAPVEPVWPQGAREAWLLVTELGAVELATQDHATGEIWCPWPDVESMARADGGAYDLEHLRVAHGMDTGALEVMTDIEERIRQVATIHGRAHTTRSAPTGSGFPHRHVPEDLAIT